MAKKLIIKKTNTINKEYNTEIDALKKWTIKTTIVYVLTIMSMLLFLTIYLIMNKVDTSILPPITHNLFKVLNIILDATLK